MTPTRALIALFLISSPAFGQKKKIDPALTTTNGFTYNVAAEQPYASWDQWIDKDGTYHAEFKDPANNWRCRVVNVSVSAATIVCSKDEVPEKRK